MSEGTVSRESFGKVLDASEAVICRIRTLSEMTTRGEAIAVMDIAEDIITVFESKINELRKNA